MDSNFSFFFQGPQKKDSSCRDFIKFYQKVGPIIVSCYDGECTAEIENDKDILIIKSPLPDLEPKQGVLKDSTFYYALYTTYQGLKNVKTKYTIKVRADEGYENLKPLISKFLDDDNNLVCGNIFFQPWGKISHHMGDHIFVAKTSILLQSYKFLLDMYDHKNDLQDSFSQGYNTAEQILCKSILYSLQDGASDYDSKEVFEKRVKVVDINEMKNYVARWVHEGIVYHNNF